ncbi:MAG TPA: tRNA (adenosine(37)-N6)-threonylcarbamoyltransferase complex dimerization subunit type 1 TsaB [Gemmatimonadales bacterium]|jgi:tRNA threonylcarbamoyladenosine biosynthesis protein TsaB
MWLALDTATDRASVALGAPGVVFGQATVAGARRHAAGLLPAIETCLAQAAAGYGDLEGIVLADGPGSFTGLRVGAAVARALIRVRTMPCWVAPSLLACAAGAGAPPGETVAAVSNALRGELFIAAYRFRPGTVETLLAPTVCRPEAVGHWLPGPIHLVGPAASTLGGQPSWPDAAQLIALVGVSGTVRLVADFARWEPHYGRPAEAQAKWEREHGRPLADPSGPGG